MLAICMLPGTPNLAFKLRGPVPDQQPQKTHKIGKDGDRGTPRNDEAEAALPPLQCGNQVLSLKGGSPGIHAGEGVLQQKTPRAKSIATRALTRSLMQKTKNVNVGFIGL